MADERTVEVSAENLEQLAHWAARAAIRGEGGLIEAADLLTMAFSYGYRAAEALGRDPQPYSMDDILAALSGRPLDAEPVVDDEF